VNGRRSCENPTLLKSDLKELLGFKGWVMSDWWAVVDGPTAWASGLDQVMPGNIPDEKVGLTQVWTNATVSANEAEANEKLDGINKILTAMNEARARFVKSCDADSLKEIKKIMLDGQSPGWQTARDVLDLICQFVAKD